MLKLKRYSFSGIGRFVEKQTIDLENRDHLIQIDGENTNTGGSSGAGKSTTVEALAYLLGISEIPSTQLQSRITKSPIWVQGEFEGGITITRSKKDGLFIETPEGTVSGNSKLAEERLDEIIGVDRKLLKTMCYKRQKQGGFFLNLTPKQSHGFLIECLDLKEYQSKIFKLEDKLKNKYKPNKIRLESSIQTLKKSFDQLGTLLEQKVKPEEPELPSTSNMQLQIDALTQKLESEEKNKDKMLSICGPEPKKPEGAVFDKQDQLNSINTSIEALAQKIENNVSEKEQSIEQATSALQKIDKKLTEALGYKDRLISEREKYSELSTQITHLEEENCPTCLRQWKGNSEEKLKELREKLGMLEENIAGYQLELENVQHYTMMKEKATEILDARKNTAINVEEFSKLDALEESRRKLLNEKENYENVINTQYLELYNKWNQSYTFVIQEFNEKASKIKMEISCLENDIKMTKMAEKSYKDAIETFVKDCENIIEKRNIAGNDLSRDVKELEQIEKDILLSEESIRLIKDFTLQKFQDTLDYIGHRATEIINMIPNMSSAVISFENVKETKTKKVKNEVNAVINLEGDSSIPIKTLSGGERTSADFAVDLAVGEMIESMTKKGVDFLIIDEGFDGLDSISKIECLEILKTLNTDKKILMVDHSSEVKEMVCDIIKVRRIKEESFVV